MQLVLVLVEDGPGALVVAVDDLADFLVDRVHGHVGDLLVLGHRTAEEDLAVVLAVGQRTEPFRQAPLRHHVARDIGRTLDVVCRTGGHVILAERHFLGNPATEERRDIALERRLGNAVLVLLGEIHRDA